MFGQFSLSSFGLIVGSILTFVGIIAYATNHPTLNLAGFFYGIPLILGGLALKVSELKPLTLPTPSSELLALRQQQATLTQNQLRKDVTRYRYGQDVHLDRALEKLDLSPSDDVRPVLVAINEAAINGAYALILAFDSPKLPLATWQSRQERLEKYFGPNIQAQVSQPTPERIELTLIATTPAASETV